MTIETANAGLSWDVLTIRRPGLTRDRPAGKFYRTMRMQ